MFKIESTLYNDCGHIANTNGVCVGMSLHLEDSSNIQRISGMSHQLMNPRGEYLEYSRCRIHQQRQYMSQNFLVL